MAHVFTLLASDIPLSTPHVERLQRFSRERDIPLNGPVTWLSPARAVDVPVLRPPTIEEMRALRSIFAGERADIVCTPVEGRRKKLFLADMDSTIVTTETLDELAAKAGIKEQVAKITARAMNGELDFHAALRERVALLKGLPVAALHETLAETVLCEGAERLVGALKEYGVTCVLVSGGFTVFTEAVSRMVGFHHHHGNVLKHDGLTLDGTVEEPILDKESKLAFLKSYAQDLGIDLAQTIAIGDGANDLPMLSAAGLGIGYRPKPVLEEKLLNVLRYADLDWLKFILTK